MQAEGTCMALAGPGWGRQGAEMGGPRLPYQLMGEAGYRAS